MRRVLNDRQAILGVDRLDYSKGLPERFRAFERLLANYPENRGRVSYIQIAPRSRDDVQDYIDIRHELESLSGSINSEYSEFDLDAAALHQPQLQPAGPRRAVPDRANRARHSAARRHEPGGQGVRRGPVAARPGSAGALALRRRGATGRRRRHRQPLRHPGRRGRAAAGAQHAAGRRRSGGRRDRRRAPRRRDGLGESFLEQLYAVQ